MQVNPSRDVTTLYARGGQAVAFIRPVTDRLLRHSAVAACLNWEGPHTPLGLSPPAMRWLSRAQRRAHDDGILLTPPAALAQELHDFAEAFCAPRPGRAAQRTLADNLSVATFIATWCLALRQNLTGSGFRHQCLAWSLEHHGALEAAGTLRRLRREAPEAHHARVVAILERMARAGAADWRRCEAAFVATLRDAEALGLSYASVAFPEAEQVAQDNLAAYRTWVLQHPVWQKVPELGRAATKDVALSRETYLWELLRIGVDADAFEALSGQLDRGTSKAARKFFELLPIYARIGNISAMAQLLAHAPTDDDNQKRRVLTRAACEAMRAEVPTALCWLFETLGPTDLHALLLCDSTTLLRTAAMDRSSLAAMRAVLAAFAAHGLHVPLTDPDVITNAIDSGCEAKVALLLDAIPRDARRDTIAGPNGDLIWRAFVRGDAAIVQRLMHALNDAALERRLRTDHARRLAWGPAGGDFQGATNLLQEAATRLHDSPVDWLQTNIAEPLASLAARWDNTAPVEAFLASHAGARQTALAGSVLRTWLQTGGSLRGVRAVRPFLSAPQVAAALRSDTSKLLRGIVARGDVAALNWAIETIAPQAAQRRDLYRDAIDGGASLREAIDKGHVAMVRFWMHDYAHGMFADTVVAFGETRIIEYAAQADQHAILDMALDHLRGQGMLDTIMAKCGANAIAFAIQRGHRSMVRKLLALPLSDATRWRILGDDNTPHLWADRGDVASLKDLWAWAPEKFRARDHTHGMLGTVIAACDYNCMPVARFALACGDDNAKRAMFAVHQGRLVRTAAKKGDVRMLEQAVAVSAPPVVHASEDEPGCG